MSASPQRVQKSNMLVERRIQAEAEYEKLCARFGTREFSEWEDSEGVPYMQLIPTYHDSFVEYFGVVLSMVTLQRLGYLVAERFPDPDPLDLIYLQDVVFQVKRLVPPTGVYMSLKVPGGYIGPASSSRYQENLTFVRLWIEEVENMDNANCSTNAELSEQADHSSKAVLHSLSAKLFLNGYSTDKLTRLLVSLGILTQSGQHTVDSKPRNWRAVVEALRDNKRMIANDGVSLYEFLVKQYDYPFKKRVIQDVFAAKNTSTQDVYARACGLLRAEE